jgi:hypothetical protein
MHYCIRNGARGSVVVKALGYKTEGRTGNIKNNMVLGSKARPVRRADNLTAIYEPTV